MSKSYFSKYKIVKDSKNVEFPNGYKDPIFGEMNSEKNYDYDYSHTTDNDDHNQLNRLNSRHPNKTIRHNLTREFKKYGVDFNGEFGDSFDNRCVKHRHMPMLTYDRKVQNGKRRFKFKKETQEIIDEALNG